MSVSHVYEAFNGSRISLTKLISDRDREMFQLVDYYVLSSIVGLLGVVANIMNIIVFYKQGFDTTMNISFFGLAVSDLCGLISLFWIGIGMSDLLVVTGVCLDGTDVVYLTGGLLHLLFSRITSWITVFITAERCLCITFPLKIKQIITPRRTTVIMCAIYVLIILSFEPEYESSYLGWTFEASRNASFLTLLFTSNRKSVEGVTYFLYSVMGCVSFIAVIIFTLVLVIQLNKKSKWRKTATKDNARSESISIRERKVMKMVVMIASVLIACYTPGVLISSSSFFLPEFSISGRYVNTFNSMWSLACVFQGLNSSVNIFLYYYMSTKYRETFNLVFCARIIFQHNRYSLTTVTHTAVTH